MLHFRATLKELVILSRSVVFLNIFLRRLSHWFVLEGYCGSDEGEYARIDEEE